MSSFPKIFSSQKKVQGVFSIGEFEAWQPNSSYAGKEPVGVMDWKEKRDVKPIVWKSAPQIQPPLAEYWKELATHVWVKAKVNTSAPRSGINMGGHRDAPMNVQFQHLKLPPPPLPPNASSHLPPPPILPGKLPPPPMPMVRPGQHMPPLPVPPPGAKAGIPAENPYAKTPDYKPVGTPVNMDELIKMKQQSLPANQPKPDLSYLQGIANDWAKMAELEWISAYTFRGDKRNPDQIKSASGFKPPSTRTDDAYIKGKVYESFKKYLMARWQIDLSKTPALDNGDKFLAMVQGITNEDESTFYQYMAWRTIVKSEELHLGRMLADETLKGYISTSRAVAVAKGFAGTGWVYVLRLSNGIVVPAKDGDHPWTKIFGEQEIAYPGGLGWDAVMGFRQVTQGKFAPGQPLYIRKSLQKEDPKTFDILYDLLSGKPQ